jgi:hypothetical protein
VLHAYETLIDPDRRSRYEAGQPVGRPGEEPPRRAASRDSTFHAAAPNTR